MRRAPSQHEVDFRYDEALATADVNMTFKLAVKTIARHHGLHRNLYAQTADGFCGSGMHINMSPEQGRQKYF